jgi:hypothetical protein
MDARTTAAGITGTTGRRTARDSTREPGTRALTGAMVAMVAMKAMKAMKATVRQRLRPPDGRPKHRSAAA